jgi:hypothetical protein
MEKNLKTLDEYPDQSPKLGEPNGYACPECGEALYDSYDSESNLQAPSQVNVHCPNCTYHGYRLS